LHVEKCNKDDFDSEAKLMYEEEIKEDLNLLKF
jgi:hypothetical protein